MRYFLFILLIALSFGIQAQRVVKISVNERQYGDPIHQILVHVFQNNVEVDKHYTNRNGEVFFTVSTTDSVYFDFEHAAYTLIGELPGTIYKKSADTLVLKLKFRFNRNTELQGVVIKPNGVPDTVFQSNRVSVNDFEFLPDGRLFLLTYPKNMRKETELVLFDGEQINGKIPLPEKGLELIKDFRGNPHVVTEKNVFGLYANLAQIELSQLDKAYYLSYIAPLVDTTTTKYFYTNFNPLYPSFDYMNIDALDSTYRKIATIEDELMMELYRSEYKWVDVRTKLWAKYKENETGIDKEIWVGANYFTKSIYYKELYAPLFERNDSVFLFDHYKNWMYRFSKNGDLMDSVAIFYHLQAKKNGWQKNIIQDQITGEIYQVFDNAGITTLRHFNVISGELGAPVELHFKFTENIHIRNNKVYYIYRPFESVQKKYLYSERLPFDFPKTKVLTGDEVRLVKP